MDAAETHEESSEHKFSAILARLGLPNAAVRAYVGLLSLGRSSVQAISERTGLERAQAYHVLKVLEDKGLVETTLSRPVQFVPIEASVAVGRLLQERQERLSEIRRAWKELKGDFKVRPGVDLKEQRLTYSLLKGRRNIYLRMVQDVLHSRNEIRLLMSSIGAIREQRFSRLYNVLLRKYRVGVKVKIITEVTRGNAQAVAKWAKLAEVRSTTPQNSNASTYDDLQTSIALFVVEDLAVDTESHISLWTNLPTFIAAMKEYFQTLWNSSTPVEELDVLAQFR